MDAGTRPARDVPLDVYDVRLAHIGSDLLLSIAPSSSLATALQSSTANYRRRRRATRPLLKDLKQRHRRSSSTTSDGADQPLHLVRLSTQPYDVYWKSLLLWCNKGVRSIVISMFDCLSVCPIAQLENHRIIERENPSSGLTCR